MVSREDSDAIASFGARVAVAAFGVYLVRMGVRLMFEDEAGASPKLIPQTRAAAPKTLTAMQKMSARIINGLEESANQPAMAPLLHSSHESPAARLLEKWRTARARNSALAIKDLETLGPEYDTEDCKEALLDYRDIERGDYDDQEEYQEARDEAWDTFVECLESLADEEEEKAGSDE